MDRKVYNLVKNGLVIKSQINTNQYYVTPSKIYVVDENQNLIKKIQLPKTKDYIVNERMEGFCDMGFDGKNMWVIIPMRDYYDKKAVLNESTLELGELTSHK